MPAKTAKPKTAIAQVNWRTLDQLDGQLDGLYQDVPVARIKAVLAVECNGVGSLPDGRPKILFEGHQFWKHLKRAGFDPAFFAKDNKDILYPRWTKKHYVGGAGEHERLARAKAIDEESALCCASYGIGQIMGFNYQLCGYDTVQAFVEDMDSPEKQLAAFFKYLESSDLLKYLKGSTPDFAKFARGYNGPGWQKNNYAAKLRRAERLFSESPQDDFKPQYKSRTRIGVVVSSVGTIALQQYAASVTEQSSALIAGAGVAVDQTAEIVTQLSDTAKNGTALVESVQQSAQTAWRLWDGVSHLDALGLGILIGGLAIVAWGIIDDRRKGVR